MIPWGVIKAKGEQGLLNADETDALVTMAEAYWRELEAAWAGVEGICPWCGLKKVHWDCPVDVLEKARDDRQRRVR